MHNICRYAFFKTKISHISPYFPVSVTSSFGDENHLCKSEILTREQTYEAVTL